MLDLHTLAGWAYAVIFLITVVDSFFPVLPAETTIIAGGALAASGDLNPVAVLAATATAVAVGDLITYEVARRGGGRIFGRWLHRDKPRRAFNRASGALHRRGAVVVAMGRFIPLGRTAVALVSGYARFPRRRYLAALVVGCSLWSLQIVGLGYFGGQLSSNPLVSVAIGLALSAVLSLVVAAVKRIRSAPAARPVPRLAARPAYAR